MIKCTRCNGNKMIIGMGGMKNKCSVCAGVGFLPESKVDDIPDTKKNNKKDKVQPAKIDQSA